MRSIVAIAAGICALASAAAARQDGASNAVAVPPEDVELRPLASDAERDAVWRDLEAPAAEIDPEGEFHVLASCRYFSEDGRTLSSCRGTGIIAVPEGFARNAWPAIWRYIDTVPTRLTDAAAETMQLEYGTTYNLRLQFPFAALAPVTERPIERQVDAGIVPWQEAFADLGYPPRMIRRGLEGNLTFDCLINADHSVTCHGAAFEPLAIPPYRSESDFANFSTWFERHSLRVRMPTTLEDGSASAGARFSATLAFRLN